MAGRLPHLLAAAAVALAAVMAPSAHAALSPYYQRTAELAAIASDPAVADKLEAKGPIEAIEAVGPDLYRVQAGGCSLAVSIVDAPVQGGPLVGPRQFAVKAGALSCP